MARRETAGVPPIVLVLTVLLAGCSVAASPAVAPLPSPSAVASNLTPAPTPGASPSPAPPSPDAPSTAAPSPRAMTLPPACDPFDPTSRAELLLSAAGDADRNAQPGLNDSAVLDGNVTPGQGWRQPDIAHAVYVAAGAPLTLWATSGEPGVRYCLGTLVIEAAPFSSLGAAPGPASMVDLDGAPEDGTPKPAFGFHAPFVGGDWVLSVQSQLLDASAAVLGTQTTFFRLEVDRPAPSSPAPVASSRVPCGRPNLGADSTAPATLLSVNGEGARKGELGGGSWNNSSAQVAGEPVPTTAIALPANAALSVSVEGHVCATAWRIVYAAIPRDTGRPAQYDPLGVLAEKPRAYVGPADPTPAPLANEMSLEPMPPGEWVLRAELYFVDGSSWTYWRVVVR